MPLIINREESAWIIEAKGNAQQFVEIEHFPWYRERSDDGFCPSCSQIEFPALFSKLFTDTPLTGTIFSRFKEIRLSGGIGLGTWKGILKRTKRCVFCRLLGQSYNDANGQETFAQLQVDVEKLEVRLHNAAIQSTGATDKGQRSPPLRVWIEISFHHQVNPGPGNDLRKILLTNKLFMFAIHDRSQCLGPEIHPKGRARIAFWELLRWLDACEATKKAKSQPSFGGMVAEDVWPDLHENLQLHSRVIDLGRRRITQAPLKCRYVALSYVWGQQNFAKLNSENVAGLEIDCSLDDLKVPATIRDAMTFCEELGERYLWIDALCIVQDTTDKHDHMRSMEAIYRGAVLTLVVATGHANHGIPGFQSKFDPAPAVTKIQGLRLVMPPSPSFDAFVNSSVWNSRAWTYQERLLSNRMIIFSKDQIYFQCKHGKAQGNMYLDPHDQLRPRAINDSKVSADDYSLQLEERVNFSVYTRIVSEYMSRRLTFPDDIENAFGGIGKIFGIIFGGSEVLYGVPLSALAICLLWYSEEPLERRRGSNATDSNSSRFPSWSWVGWIGRVGFRQTRNIGDRLISKVSWLDPLNKLDPLSNEHFGPPERDWEGRSRWFRQMSMKNGDHYYIRRQGNPAHWFPYPMEPFIHNAIPIDRETGFLHLRTRLAEFRVKSYLTDQQRLILCNERGVRVGIIKMDGDTPPLEKDTTVTVLQLSQTTLKEGDDDPAWNPDNASYSKAPGSLTDDILPSLAREEHIFDPTVYPPTVCWCLYNVLAITAGERRDQSQVWYRCGIGQVHIDAFDKIADLEEYITLG